MKLYIHIGTEKTGSSFLQSLIYSNNEILEKKYNIYIPDDLVQDKRMQLGIISGGNGVLLHDTIDSSNHNKLFKYLYKIKSQALDKECNSILVSNENLFRVIGRNFKMFIAVCEDLEIDLKMCLFLRNPAKHIISMYKHRNKSGKYATFSSWINSYNTLDDLEVFVSCFRNNTKIDILKVLSYNKNITIEKSFFQDFLEIPAFDDFTIKYKNVNTSLTFSEISILQNLYKKDILLANKLSSGFQRIVTSEKAKDSNDLIGRHNYLTIEYILKHYNKIKYIYNFFNIMIPPKLKFIEEKSHLEKIINLNKECGSGLSIKQIEAVLYVFKKNKKLNNFLILSRRKLVKCLVPNRLMKYIKYYRL